MTDNETAGFQTTLNRDAEGVPCLRLDGELDLTVASQLYDRLWGLAEGEQRLRLDLSGLTFIDSTGISVLVVATRNAREHGWRLEIDPEVAPAVRRTLETSGVHGLLWPPDGD